MKTAVVIGSTGLIGSLLLEKLAQDGSYSQILAVTRKPLPDNSALKSGRIRTLIFDFKDWHNLELQVRSFAGTSAVHLFCCLGTTIAAAGSQEAFYRVDYEYVVNFARMGRAVRAEKLLVVSALGADSRSSVFYNRVKGEMEARVGQEFSGQLHFLRPSLLMGDRQQFRFGERMAVLLAPLYTPLLVGSWKKYRPVQAERVAQVMIDVATNKRQASRVIMNGEMIV